MPGSKPKILAADDTPSVIALLGEVLGADHEVLFATNGREAVERAAAEVPDLVLLDALMPELDGFATCAALKANRLTADIPVIFITALEDEAEEVRALQLGAYDFISKPIRPAILRARVRNCLELKGKRDALARLSSTDALTGVANRRRLDQFLEMEWRRVTRSQLPLSVLMVDLDEFKAFNDAAGHLAGDEALRRVAGAIQAAVHRPGDLVARYGGEEFACVLAETDVVGAGRVATRIQDLVNDLAIPHPRSSVGPLVTLSIGVAVDAPRARGSPAALLEAADRALYRAKAAGRNRIALAPALDAPAERAPASAGRAA
jgi:diguanylate cyclase (GGDEF)-like protein